MGGSNKAGGSSGGARPGKKRAGEARQNGTKASGATLAARARAGNPGVAPVKPGKGKAKPMQRVSAKDKAAAAKGKKGDLATAQAVRDSLARRARAKGAKAAAAGAAGAGKGKGMSNRMKNILAFGAGAIGTAGVVAAANYEAQRRAKSGPNA